MKDVLMRLVVVGGHRRETAAKRWVLLAPSVMSQNCPNLRSVRLERAPSGFPTMGDVTGHVEAGGPATCCATRTLSRASRGWIADDGGTAGAKITAQLLPISVESISGSTYPGNLGALR